MDSASLPDYITGSGDIVYWKDGRDVYDSVSTIYHYPNGVKMSFDSVIANKRYGMDEQVLGSKGTLELSRDRLYHEEPPSENRDPPTDRSDRAGSVRPIPFLRGRVGHPNSARMIRVNRSFRLRQCITGRAWSALRGTGRKR